MATIRWFEISAALARLGHTVDMAVRRPLFRAPRPIETGAPGSAPETRLVSLGNVRWPDYDVVKTLFHEGFRTLERYGGADSPFIISKLGSVVGPEEMEGIHFFGRRRRRMFEVQERMARTCRYVTVLTEPARDLWRRCFGSDDRLLLVPGAAPSRIPPAGHDPYPADARPRCVFAGNFYSTARTSQPEAHRAIARKLNELGARLLDRGQRLYVVGPGDSRSLDPESVTYLGTATYQDSWNYLHYANVGVVVAAGPMHNNESTKIYHYLRVGLPVVSERGFPNGHVVLDSGGGLLSDGDAGEMADAVAEACATDWDRDRMIRYIERHHTWDRRAEVYDRVLREELAP